LLVKEKSSSPKQWALFAKENRAANNADGRTATNTRKAIGKIAAGRRNAAQSTVEDSCTISLSVRRLIGYVS
jgi:hypothetical protein